MDETLTQHCMLCGECIIDYRGAMVPAGQGPISGWESGEIYVSNTNNPKIYMKQQPCECEIKKCQ